jgi:quercetin dioxygenase-like cupin family protein
VVSLSTGNERTGEYLKSALGGIEMGGTAIDVCQAESGVRDDVEVARPFATARVLVTGQETGGQLAMIETRLEKGASQPMHVHQDEDVIVYVLAGEVAFYLDGDRHTCREGGCLVLPIGREHSFIVESVEARLLVILMPGGLERLYDELRGPDSSTVAGVERLVTAAARHGVSITGPAPCCRADQNGNSILDLPIP